MKLVGENDKCRFYRTEKCEEYDKMDEYIQKYGEGVRFLMVEFKDPNDRNPNVMNEYLIIDGKGEGVGTMVEYKDEFTLRRELEYLHSKMFS